MAEAVVTVMVIARARYLKESTRHLEGRDREDAIAQKRANQVALGSEVCHSCTQKAAMIVGMRYLSVPTKPEDGFSMRGSTFYSNIEKRD
jgi:aromatic-L-amino-acid/L-tryptophan decarboxylase